MFTFANILEYVWGKGPTYSPTVLEDIFTLTDRMAKNKFEVKLSFLKESFQVPQTGMIFRYGFDELYEPYW